MALFWIIWSFLIFVAELLDRHILVLDVHSFYIVSLVFLVYSPRLSRSGVWADQGVAFLSWRFFLFIWALKVSFLSKITPSNFACCTAVSFSPKSSSSIFFTVLRIISCVFLAFNFILHLDHHACPSLVHRLNRIALHMYKTHIQIVYWNRDSN